MSSTTDILNVANMMQGTAILAHNARLAKMKRVKLKHIMSSGIGSIVGSTMSSANANIIAGMK